MPADATRSLRSTLLAGAVVALVLAGCSASAGPTPTTTPRVNRQPASTPEATAVPPPTEVTALASTVVPPADPPDPEEEALVIGTSVAGRPLQAFRFGSGERELLIAAGIHGGYEWNTIALADELIRWLQTEPDHVPDEITLYILRSVNPDGEARSNNYLGRANDNGVDLNRNWPTNWHDDWDRTYCWNHLPISAGPHPVSEPETEAVMRFILDHDFQALISYHSAALGIYPGGAPPDDASRRLAQALAAASGYHYPPYFTGCEYTGQFADWAASQGIPAVDVELTTHYATEFDINVRLLKAFFAWRP